MWSTQLEPTWGHQNDVCEAQALTHTWDITKDLEYILEKTYIFFVQIAMKDDVAKHHEAEQLVLRVCSVSCKAFLVLRLWNILLDIHSQCSQNDGNV